MQQQPQQQGVSSRRLASKLQFFDAFERSPNAILGKRTYEGGRGRRGIAGLRQAAWKCLL